MGKAGLKTSWLTSVKSSLREGNRQSLRPKAPHTVHLIDEVVSRLPIKGKLSWIGVPAPCEPRQGIKDHVGHHLKPLRRDPMIRLEFSILSAAGTGNLNAGFIVATRLIGIQYMDHPILF